MALSWTRLYLRNLTRRNFHTTKCTSLFYESSDKDGYSKPTEEQIKWEKLPYKEKLKIEWEFFKLAMREYVADWKKNNSLYGTSELLFPEHHVQMIHKFTGDKDEMKKWIVSCDSDHQEGYSTAKLEYTRDSKALFHGFLDTRVPKDGKVKEAGYANLKLIEKTTPLLNKVPYSFDMYTHIVCRIRGDGRIYLLNLHLDYIYDVGRYDTFHYYIWTRGGPYWEYIRIPFSNFIFAYKGRIQVTQQPVPKNHISTVSITLADKIIGPFKLEVDYIGVEYDPSHIEDTAYELYSFGEHRFW